MATVGTLNINFATNVAQLINDMNKASRSVQQSSSAMTRTLKGVEGSIKGVIAGFAGFVSVQGIENLVNSSLEYADSIQKAALRTGLAVREVQAYGFGAKLAGVDQEAFTTAIGKFNIKLGEAVQGNQAAGETFRKLGVDIDAVKNGQLSTGDAFLQSADAISHLGTSAEQAAATADIFGSKLGPKFVGLIEQGRDGILRYAQQAENLGLVLDESVTSKAEEAKDKLETMGEIVKVNFTGGLLDAFLTDFKEMSDIATDPAFADGMRGIGELVGLIGNFAFHAANGLGLAVAGLHDLLNTDASSELASVEKLINRPEVRTPAAASQKNKAIEPAELDSLRKRKAALESQIAAAKKTSSYEYVNDDFAKMRQQYEKESEELKKINVVKAQHTQRTKSAAAATKENSAVIDHSTSTLHNNAVQTQELDDDILKVSRDVGTFSSGVQSAGDTTDGLRSSFADLGATFSSAFEEAIIGGQKFSDVLQGLAQDIERILIRKTVTDPLTKGIEGLVGGLDFGSLFGGGNIFSSAASATDGIPGLPLGLPAFASGGITSGPSLAGESGPEAIVPLSGGRSIPVALYGQSGGAQVITNIEIINQSGQQVQESRQKNSSGGDDITVIVGKIAAAEAARPGSELNRAIRSIGNAPITRR